MDAMMIATKIVSLMLVGFSCYILGIVHVYMRDNEQWLNKYGKLSIRFFFGGILIAAINQTANVLFEPFVANILTKSGHLAILLGMMFYVMALRRYE